MDKAAKYASRKKPAVSSTRKATGQLGRWADTRKPNQRLLPSVKQHLLMQPQGDDRHYDMLHVSELAKSDWCPRAAYLRIAQVRSGKPWKEEAPSFELDNIYSEGDQVHEKWQQRFWEMGVLFGTFQCRICQWQWEGVSPDSCPQGCADVTRDALRYREVNMRDPDHMLVAHSDAEIRDREGVVLVEVKTVGIGTVRVEAPSMLAEYTRKIVDEDGEKHTYVAHDELWRDLRRPFPAHRRQALLYLYLRGLMTEKHGWPELKKIVMIYEYKPTQRVKEFILGPDPAWVEEVLEECKDVMYALETGKAPACSRRGELCKKCQVFEDKDHDDTEHESRTARRGDGEREAANGRPAAKDAVTTGRRTVIARRPDRPGRPGADVPADAPHSVGGLLRRAAGDGVGRRASS